MLHSFSICSGFSQTSVTLERPRSDTLPRFLGRGVWGPYNSWQMGNMTCG
jgi:hypothetical protein